MLCWIATPTIFAAIVLSTVSILDGILAPSVAFTALAIFQRLELTLSLVPEFATDFFNAWVSCGRVEEFLNSPERVDATVHADVVHFEGASIAWPSSDEKQSPRGFSLRDLNLSFPRHELSIIAGPTAAGKSLLLAAAIGEADILRGKVLRPKSDLDHHQSHITTMPRSSGGWIAPNTTAFVAQTPWIENATLRDNVLFGLPFSQARYAVVLQACALEQDLAEMERGDSTEIGSHGINLSGGQSSRLALARALYSRAEMLIVDDVFSAVDAHVGRHILEHALTGEELTKGRTLIVATHHVQMCLPKAEYVVLLDNGGTVEYAGPPGAVVQKFNFARKKNGGEKEDGELNAVEDASTSETDQNPTTPQEVSPRRTGRIQTDNEVLSNEVSRGHSDEPRSDHLISSALGSDLSSDRKGKSSSDEPNGLAGEEEHATGMVNLNVYRAYMRAASSWPSSYWAIVFVLLVG